MKKIVLLPVLLSAFLSFCSAQYRIKKDLYDTHEYSYQMGDPYNPAIMAFSSALIPGMGQILEEEPVRGIGFLGGFLSLVAIRRVTMFAPYEKLNYTQKDIIRWVTFYGRQLLRVWSAFDAAHVAKIENLAFRAKYGAEISIKIFPNQYLAEPNFVSKSTTIGITLLVSF